MASKSSHADRDIAVIGMACRFPGAANYEEFWRNLAAGVSSISEIPAERWDWRSYWGDPATEANKTNCRWGGFIEHAYRFDAPFFHVNAREATLMDPQQRVLLELAWSCLEDAGYAPLSFSKQPTGVFVGICNYDYKETLDRSAREIEGYFLTGTANSIVPNRISQFFDFQGPSLSIDTACSSSLFALDQAIKAIHAGECTAALAGGVNLLLSPERFIPLSQLGMLTTTGACRSFDAAADGYVRGEGAGLVLLKTLRQARRDGDRILGVIKRCEVNHGGRARSLTSPNVYAQARLVASAYAKAGIPPETITYIEAHGTGTPLGDPIEINGLRRAFTQLYREAQKPMPETPHCGVGTVKSNIGHLEGSAGIAGVIKTLLCLQHRQLPPLAGFRETNPKINVKGSPLYLVDALRPWDSVQDSTGLEVPRRAGISSFGFGGSNAHVVVEEYVPRPSRRMRKARPAQPALVLLSAANSARLQESARRLLNFVSANPEVDLTSLAYTLQSGRQAMTERLAIVATDVAGLRSSLEAFASGVKADQGIHTGRVDAQSETVKQIVNGDAGREILRAAVQQRDLNTLAACWVAGAELPLSELKPRWLQRLALPTYPFAGETYGAPAVGASLADARERQPRVTPPPPSIPAPVTPPIPRELARPQFALTPAAAQPAAEPARAAPAATAPLRLSLQPLTAFSASTAAQPAAAPVSLVERDAGIWEISIQRSGLTAATANPAAAEIARRAHEAATKGDARVLLLTGFTDASLLAGLESLVPALEIPVVVEVGEVALAANTLSAASHDLAAQTTTGIELARALAAHPRIALTALKRHLRTLSTDLASAPAAALVPAFELAPLHRPAAGRVKLDLGADGVALVTMADVEGKNTFTDELVRELTAVFAYLERAPECKVIVLTGHERTFAAGGTKENLLAIQEGRMRFTDSPVYSLGLTCALPVIAAMQGHAIGAGWSLGMFCDETIFSEEAVYGCPYMRYGFTPGAGSTLIFPERFGRTLAWEMLFSARDYKGHELKARGIRQPVLPRAEVLPFALARARELAATSRRSLMHAKAERTAQLRAWLAPVCEREVRLHETTFVGNREVLENIHAQYGATGARQQDATTATAVAESTAGQLDLVRAKLRSLLAAELQVAADALDCDSPFLEMGLDSITGVTWVRAINKEYRLSIAATQIYSHPTLNKFAVHVLAEATAAGRTIGEPVAAPLAAPAVQLSTAPLRVSPPPQTQVATPSADHRTDDAVAVIGMAGRFPQARSLQEFWANLASGRDCISEVPAERWPVDDYFDADRRAPGKTVSRWLGVLPGADEFDPGFFNLSPLDAEQMDPQQRVFLQACWHCVEDAGYAPSSLSGQRCGVFVGCAPGDYGQWQQSEELTAQKFMGGASSILAARIAYLLNLRGPCLAIDTACSASLVAIAQACEQLRSGACDQALAGGVCVLAGPGMHIMTSKAGMLSPDGRCFTFDERANGFVPGEGVGVVLLKRLADAQRDGDEICGIIRGWGVNQDGRTNGITAPNGDAQTELERGVYAKFGIDPQRIQLVETHGTATRLGDPVEVDALKAAFRTSDFAGEKSCALGSVKSNVGHLLTAAGIAGFIKVLLAFKHRKLPPTINFERLNSHLSLDDSPFYVNTSCRDWNPGQGSRLAALSSFGFSGTNAHVVIEEGRSTRQVIASASPVLLVLSAKNAERLRGAVGQLRDALRGSDDLDLRNVAYTLQLGRDAMACRMAFVARDLADAVTQLEAYLAGESGSGRIHSGMIGGNQAAAAQVVTAHADRLDEVARQWVRGAKIDWAALYSSAPAWRVQGLPGYPFARERYWLRSGNEPRRLVEECTGDLRPVLQNASGNVEQPVFALRATGREFFLCDHRVHGQNVLPGVAHLELARAAAAQVFPENADSGVRLERIVWTRPLVVDATTPPLEVRVRAESVDRVAYEISVAGDTRSYSQGVAVSCPVASAPQIELAALKVRLTQTPLTASACYEAFRAMGLEYGPAHRGLRELFTDGNQVLAKVTLPACAAASRDRFVLHPAVLDAALQASVGLMLEAVSVSGAPKAPARAPLPFAVESLEIFRASGPEVWVWIRPSPHASSTSSGSLVVDVDLCDDAGSVQVRLNGLSLRTGETRSTATTLSETLLLEPVWQDLPAVMVSPATDASQERWVILCGAEQWSPHAIEARLGSTRCVRLDTTGEVATWYAAAAQQLLAIAQDLCRRKPAGGVSVQLLVAGTAEQQFARGLFALLQTAAQEWLSLRVQCLLIDARATAGDVVALLQQNSGRASGTCIRQHAGGLQMLGWADLEVSASVASSPWSEDGVYLITGGAGGLGWLFAHDILQHARRATVVLTGRSILTSEQESRVRQLSASGGRAEYRRCDVTEGAAVDALIRAVLQEHGKLTGVLHAAGVTADSRILEKSNGQLQQVLAPKLAGTVHLDAATRHLPLECFVLFSSYAAVHGNPGQADYATANAFMDAFAAHRRQQVLDGRRSGVTCSVNWPLWNDGGMQIDAATKTLMLNRAGLVPLRTASGLQAFYRVLGSDRAQVAVVEGSATALRKFWKIATAPRAQMPSPAPTAIAAPTVDDEVLRSHIQRSLLQLVASLLKFDPGALDPDTELAEFGFDSITLTEFANRVNESYRLALTPAVFFEYSTIRGFAQFLARAHAEELAQALGLTAPEMVSAPIPREQPLHEPEPVAPAAREAAPVASSARDGVAIIGISGRFPMAADLDAYWTNLREGRDCISEVPGDRWDWKALFGDPAREPDKTNIKWGGFMEGVGDFDPRFFGIAPREAELMDPHQRLLLMYVWKAIEDAGYSVESLSGSRTGVFIGTGNSGYDLLVAKAGVPVEGFTSTGMVPSVGPNRISYLMNWHGPSEPVETACSSALVAIHRGVHAIESGQCPVVVVGGVNALVQPAFHVSFNKAGMLCEDGRCKTFSADANGYVRGEGVGILVLKRLSLAETDGDQIYGVIRGTAENHGGRTNSLTAPNPAAQADVIQQAFTKADFDPRTVSYIEAHGTGTALGDPVEVNGLKKAYAELLAARNGVQPSQPHCAVGSVKTNIGHLELAAGVAGVIKVLLQMKHRTLVKSLHCQETNPYIDLAQSPFYLLNENRPWPTIADSTGKALPRRAGVSSFGFGGVNAHVLIEEYVSRQETPVTATPPVPAIFVLSAKTEERLKTMAQNLATFIEAHAGRSDADALELSAVAYTLQVGREAMEERLCFIATSLDDAQAKLRAFASGVRAGDSVYRGHAGRFKEVLAEFSTDRELREAVEKWIERKKWSQLAALWTKGLSVDWQKLYPTSKPRRISLPTYAFDLKRYWVPVATHTPTPSQRVSTPAPATAMSSATTSAAIAGLAPVMRPTASAAVKETPIVIAGAGLFGICLAYHLKQAGIEFVLLEREKGVGGVWYKNTWPGCGCDIPMIAYAYSFLHYQGPVWAKQPDILRYLETCVAKFGLAEHLQLETTVESATFDEAEGAWTVQTAEGRTFKSQYFCNAMGSLGLYPKIPALPGLTRFRGPIVHALEYAAKMPDVRGRRVAIIGNGATQLQMVEALQPQVEHLAVYGRTAKFVYPRARYNKETEEALNNDEGLWQIAREEYLKHADQFFEALHDPVRLNPFKPGNEVKTFFNRIYDSSHEEYYQWCREKGLIPDYSPGCNRPLISNTYHQVIRAPNVEVLQAPEFEITETGIRSAAGEREYDVILLCTGYDLNNFRPKIPIYGKNGISLTDHYGDGFPKAFITYVRDFPNLILGPGPNTGTSSTSITAIYEFLSQQLVKQVQYCRQQRASSYNIREEKVRDFVDYVIAENAKGPFNSGCSSFYRDANNVNVAIFPGKFAALKEMYAFAPNQFEYATATAFSARMSGGAWVADSAPRLVDAATVAPAIAAPVAAEPVATTAQRALRTEPSEQLIAHLKRIAADALRIPFEEMDERTGFQEYGVDSIMMISITRRLNEHFPELTTDVLLRFSNLAGVAEYLQGKHGEMPAPACSAASVTACAGPAPTQVQACAPAPLAAPAEPTISTQPAPAPARAETRRGGPKDIAVIGMSGRFPQSPTIAEFWKNLREGRECIDHYTKEALRDTGIAEEELNHPEYVRSKPRVDGSDRFDPLFFAMSPLEAATMDPQHRLILEESWRALEDAGYPPDSKRHPTAVYISQFTTTYGEPFTGPNASDMVASDRFKAMLGADRDYIATRIAYKFNFTGPAYTVQTACSSSLAGIHLCAEALRNGTCDMGLVGGVALTQPTNHGYFYEKDMIFTPDGHCRPFSADANGTIFGEAVGAVVLKRLEDAERDGDAIYAVIRGTAVNNDGREKRDFTAPGFWGQCAVIGSALDEAGISPEKIGYVEAHATGTKLGDPLEFSALTEVYRSRTQRQGFCSVGSVKANVGHLNTAAGITGFIKTVMCLHRGEMPPLIHADVLNPDIRVDGSPFYFNRDLRAWPRPAGGRYAAVSSFGIGGTNVHMILSDYADPRPDESRPVPKPGAIALIPLSAKNKDRLNAVVGDLLVRIADGTPKSHRYLHEVAFTLQMSRLAMEERIGLTATSLEDLAAKLRLVLQGNDAEAGARRGHVKRARSSGKRILPNGNIGHLIDHWVQGDEIEWAKLHRDLEPRRVHLPGYPFAGERYNWKSLRRVRNSSVRTLVCRRTWVAKEAPARGAVIEDVRELILGELSPESGTATRLLLKASNPTKRFEEAAAALLLQLQSVMREKPRQPILLRVVVPARGPDQGLSALAGMLRSVRFENPLVLGQLIEIEPDTGRDALQSILEENRRSAEEVHVRYSKGQRLVPSWDALPSTGPESNPPWRDGGVYLITGGAGGLGLVFAEAIATGVRQPTLVLVGRSPLSPNQEAKVKSLQDAGARVMYRRVDISDVEETAAVVRLIESEYGRLDGVLHAAGLTRDGFVLEKTVATLKEVLAPKVSGVANLDFATRASRLEFFIVFSSTVGALGHASQADYAAANAYLDAFAHARNELVRSGERNGRTLSLNWGLWKEGGIQLEDGFLTLIQQRTGMVPMETVNGLDALRQCWASGAGQLLVVDGDVVKLKQGLLATPALPAMAPSAPANTPAAVPAGLREDTRRALKSLLGQVTELPVDRIDAHEALQEYGIDSLMITTLNERLARVFGEISKTLFFEHQTLAALADYFAETYPDTCRKWTGASAAGQDASLAPVNLRAGGDRPARMHAPEGEPPEPPQLARRMEAEPVIRGREVPVPTEEAVKVGTAEPIAIIGLSGRYPQARNLAEFWENLRAGKNCVTEIPEERWRLDEFYEADPARAVEHGRSYSKWGGFIEDFANFDPLFFAISPREALNMDPQERLVLQCAWEALEDAGITREALAKSYQQRVGVFVGITQTGFNLYGLDPRVRDEGVFPHTSFSSAANRISYVLNVKGPSMPIDTMCSSSLTAIHEACEKLRHGGCELAIAGGVNLYAHPSTYVGLCAAKMLSRDGACKSFGQGGNGYVPGEGVGMVVLKPLSKAVADGDPIHAVIRATEVNHGGHTNGYTVPNPKAQAELIRSTLEKGGVSARTISYIEAHGTGTELGDPIEIAGLTQAFRSETKDTAFCAIGSAKSNLGHLEAAAGIAGLTKIVLQLQHREIVPSLHAETLNPNIAFKQTPFVVQRELGEWRQPSVNVKGMAQSAPRRAGISSFGAGGANAHAILEEFIPAEESNSRGERAGPVMIVLSAKTEDRLKAVAQNLHRHLASESFRANATTSTLTELAFTLQAGREAMEERLAFTAETLAGVEATLLAYIEGRANVDGLRRGRVSDSKETLALFSEDEDLAESIDIWVQKRKFSKLLDLWVKGLALDWTRIYPRAKPARLHLPTYPFAGERFWFDSPATLAPRVAVSSTRSAADAVQTSEWLWVKEGWETQALPDGVDWVQRLQSHAGQRIAVVASEPAQAAALVDRLRQLANAGPVSPGFEIESMVTTDLAQRSFRSVPEVILFLGTGRRSDVETAFRLSHGLMRTAWERRVSIYYASDFQAPEAQADAAALSGFVGAAMMENPLHRWMLVEHMQTDAAVSTSQRLLQEWLADDRPVAKAAADTRLFQTASVCRIRWEASERAIWRRSPLPIDMKAIAASPFRAGGTYLVAGGLGLIGAELCVELARRFQATLVILGRAALDERKSEQCTAIERAGGKAHYFAVDVLDSAALEATLTRIRSEVGAIHGVLQLVTSHDVGLIATKTWEVFATEIAAKVDGTLNLDRATAGDALDFFVLFSSIGAYGIRGSSAHSYACAFQSAFAREREALRTRGERHGISRSLCWGPWDSDPVHGAADPKRAEKIAADGFSLHTIAASYPAIEAACLSADPVLGIFKVRDRATAERRLGLAADVSDEPNPELVTCLAKWERRQRAGETIEFSELAKVISPDQVPELPADLIERIDALFFPAEEVALPPPAVAFSAPTGDLRSILREMLAEVLKLKQVDDRQTFQNYGMDSVTAMVFVTRLERKLERPLKPEWLIDQPTIERLCRYLEQQAEPVGGRA